ncbi:MAG: response regulator, partial [Bacteroidota bacterium]|nr:response regulator [Bacteroidota bacterium]
AISGGGLFRYNPVNDSFDFRNIRLDNILVVTETKNDQLIIGNYSGVTVYDLKHRKLLIFHTNTPVRSICEDKQRAIWIGTEGNGLMNLNLKTHKLTPASHKLDYLKKSTIMSIIEDEHQNLWISTSNGLFRFHYPTEVLTTFNKKDGLQDEQFNYSSSLKSEKGMMLFGGINGFTFFDPDKITTAQPAYPLHITDLSIHNSSIFTNKNKYGYIINMLSKKEIRVKHKDAYIRFDFIAISYDNPDKIQYAYMLDHMDKNWIIAGNSRSANYSGLPPGHYTFKVSYATQPGQWNKKVLEVKLHVLPPYYLTWWAFLIYLICTSAIAYSIIHFQKRQNKLKQDLLLADLKEEQVRQVQQMREQFFINISHELRTPLTLIIPPIKDSLTSVPFAPIGKAELQTVYNNANRLLLLINKLLLFRKNEICKNQLRLTKTDFVDFAGKIYKNFSQIAVKRNISYVFKAPNGPVPFWFDLDKMEIILYNLLSNAFKFTPEYGKIELEIFVEDNAQLCLSVKDTGCGISQADLDHIFNRFYSSNKSSGIGIGLSLVKNYIELLHGELTIETALEKGSTFSIRFDMNAHYEEQEMVKETVPEYLPSKDMVELVKIDTLLYLDQHTKEKEEALSLNKPKILVVEDNPEILAYIKRILLETGQYDVLEASNGKVAWKMAKKTLPDMILSDIYMPEMDGLDLCKAIKEEEETNHIYFILITADLFDATENKALKYGADEYITKPFDKDKLLNKIKTIFNYQQKIRKYFNNKIILGKKETVPTTVNTDFIDKCIKQVKDNYTSEEFSPLILAQKMNMSQSALYKKIKLCTGKSINEFIRTIKLSIASELILQSSLSISEIATEVGINDVKYFRDCFKKQFGVTPSQYKSTGHLTDNAPLTQETDDID